MRRLVWLPVAAALSTLVLNSVRERLLPVRRPARSRSRLQPAGGAADARRSRAGHRARVVRYVGREAPGTVIVNTQERRLYLVQSGGTAIRYGIGVGREGFQWAGVKTVERKAMWPDWRPPGRRCSVVALICRATCPAAKTIRLARAPFIWAARCFVFTAPTSPSSIGHAVSSGCIRMLNEDGHGPLTILVKVGTKVVVSAERILPPKTPWAALGPPFFFWGFSGVRHPARTFVIRCRHGALALNNDLRAEPTAYAAARIGRQSGRVSAVIGNSRPMLGTSSCEFRNHKPHYKRLI